jgi:hypothetical protein
VGKEQVSAATLGSYIRGVVIPLVELPRRCSFTREIDLNARSCIKKISQGEKLTSDIDMNEFIVHVYPIQNEEFL